YARAGRITSSLPPDASLGRNVADDEQLLAGPDKPELAACEVFDGGGIFTEATSGFAKRRVLVAELIDLSRQVLGLPPGAPHAHQPAVTDEAGNEDGRARPDQHDPHESLRALPCTG